MAGLLERVGRGETVLSDGGLGTQLIDRGLEPGQCPEALVLERPEVLAEIGSLYLDAGAEILTTNTFGGSPFKLKHYSLDEKTEQINCRAVEILRDVAGDRVLVGASVGPTGAILEPRLAPGLPVVATMTFDPTPRGYFTIMGVSVEQAVNGLAEAGADVVGSNCGNGIEKMVEIARELRRHSRLPIAIQANAGLPESRAGQVVYPESPEFMAGRLPELVELGVAVIGGCCGTTPDHIRAMKSALAR